MPEADRVSAKQLFARDVDIVAVTDPCIHLHLDVPGRAYIRHVKNATEVAAGLFGRVRASDDTRGAVEVVNPPKAGDYGGYGGYSGTKLTTLTNFWSNRSDHKSESLLVEVKFYEKNVLQGSTTSGSADLVVLEDVLCSAPVKDPTGNNVVDTKVAVNKMSNSPGNLFVSDPKGRFHTSSLSVFNDDFMVQLDFAAMNITQTELWVFAEMTSSVTVFAPEFAPPFRMDGYRDAQQREGAT